eukprot:COSAG06_NODE_14605_length_1143_cov_180.103448_1_plen_64_part_00
MAPDGFSIGELTSSEVVAVLKDAFPEHSDTIWSVRKRFFSLPHHHQRFLFDLQRVVFIPCSAF